MKRAATATAAVHRAPALALLGAISVGTVYPLIWLVLNSLKCGDEMFEASWALPQAWQWANYPRAWRFGLGHFMANSVLITAVSVVAIVLLGEVSLFPLFKIMLVLGIYNTYFAMILPDIAYGLPFTVLLLRAYMTQIPMEMAEAARIDGAGLLRCFWSVYLPLARPALAAAALVQGMRVWNEFIFALTFVGRDALRPLTVGLTTFGDSLQTDWPVLLSGLVISIVPVLTVFLSMQRQFMGGLTTGALK